MIDPSIALSVQSPQFRSPVESYGNVLSLKNMMSQGRQQDINTQMAERDLETYDQRQGAQNKLQQQQLDLNQMNLDKGQLDAALQKTTALGQILSMARDPYSYKMALEQAASILPPEVVAKAPQQYDPKFIEDMQFQTLSLKDQLDYQLKVQNSEKGTSTMQEYNLAQQDPAFASFLDRNNQSTTAPSGYRFTENGDLQAIPGGPKDIAITPAQQAVDREFAKEYSDFVTSGGIADVEKQLNQLETVVSQLEGGENLTGGILGRTPDWLRQVTGHSESIAARDAVEEVVQRNLRLILGAQFTEKEGERLIARAYNDKLGEKENATRVRRLIKQIRDAAQSKADAANYYEENGTLSGWKGRIPNLNDFHPEGDKKEEYDPLGLR
jgi:hypothetical protein